MPAAIKTLILLGFFMFSYVTAALSSAFFREFVVNFDDTGKTVEEINKMLLEKGIFGGKDLSQTFPELGQSALFCITERHTASDIHKLVKSIESILK